MDPSTPGTVPTRAQLQGSLQSLHEQLASTSRIDADARGLLQQLLTDVQRLLQLQPQRAAAAQETAVADDETAAERPFERLESLAVQFEAEHPRLAGSLRQFVELCSRAGL